MLLLRSRQLYQQLYHKSYCYIANFTMAAAAVGSNGCDVTEATGTASASFSLSSLADELLLRVAEYLPVSDLVRYQGLAKKFRGLDADATVWKRRCEARWEPWPRYRLTRERHAELLLLEEGDNDDGREEQRPHPASLPPRRRFWESRYAETEREASRSELRPSDLHGLRWHLSFVLSGVRGETMSDPVEVAFDPTTSSLLVPGYPPLPYRIVLLGGGDDGRVGLLDSQRSRIRPDLRGDRPFSATHYVEISNFPPHLVSRKRSDAEWLIVNENVVIVSSKR